MKKILFIIFLQCSVVMPVFADVISKEINYEHASTPLKGEMYWDDSLSGKRPGVIVVHEWWGLNDYAKSRAKMLAEMGYVAFAIDMYGAGKSTQHPDQAAEWMKMNTENIEHWRSRALTALNILKQTKQVDADKLAAIGYCFGGATVIQMAYAGADLEGVVSFHGSLPLPGSNLKKGDIKSKILVAHGGADSFVPREHVTKFEASLESLEVDMQFVTYSGAKHGFTNPSADSVGMEALEYSPETDRRSWQMMQQFFNEIFN